MSFYNKKTTIIAYDKAVTKFHDIDGMGVFSVAVFSAIVALLNISCIIIRMVSDTIGDDIITFYNIMMPWDMVYIASVSAYVYCYYRCNKRADLLVAKLNEVDATIEESVYIIQEIYRARPSVHEIQSDSDIKNFLIKEGKFGLAAIAITLFCVIGMYVSYSQTIVKPLTAYAKEHQVTFDNIVSILDKDTIYIESAKVIIPKSQVDAIKKQQKDEILSKVINK